MFQVHLRLHSAQKLQQQLNLQQHVGEGSDYSAAYSTKLNQLLKISDDLKVSSCRSWNNLLFSVRNVCLGLRKWLYWLRPERKRPSRRQSEGEEAALCNVLAGAQIPAPLLISAAQITWQQRERHGGQKTNRIQMRWRLNWPNICTQNIISNIFRII